MDMLNSSDDVCLNKILKNWNKADVLWTTFTNCKLSNMLYQVGVLKIKLVKLDT